MVLSKAELDAKYGSEIRYGPVQGPLLPSGYFTTSGSFDEQPERSQVQILIEQGIIAPVRAPSSPTGPGTIQGLPGFVVVPESQRQGVAVVPRHLGDTTPFRPQGTPPGLLAGLHEGSGSGLAVWLVGGAVGATALAVIASVWSGRR